MHMRVSDTCCKDITCSVSQNFIQQVEVRLLASTENGPVEFRDLVTPRKRGDLLFFDARTVAEWCDATIGNRLNRWLILPHPGTIEEGSDMEIRVNDKSLNTRSGTFIRLTVAGRLSR